MSCSVQTTVLASDFTSGLAIAPGTGVTTLIQCELRVGESTGTGTMTRLRSPATRA